MAYNDLREWILTLDRAGELKRIRTEVDPILEITEIADRLCRRVEIIAPESRHGSSRHAYVPQ